jgi:hypothetical protein
MMVSVQRCVVAGLGGEAEFDCARIFQCSQKSGAANRLFDVTYLAFPFGQGVKATNAMLFLCAPALRRAKLLTVIDLYVISSQALTQAFSHTCRIKIMVLAPLTRRERSTLRADSRSQRIRRAVFCARELAPLGEFMFMA